MKISLKAYRTNANLSVEEVAKSIGVSTKTIYFWESDTNKFKKATLDKVIKLAKLYKVKVNDLLP